MRLALKTSSLRVHEFAKELNISPQDVIDALRAANFDMKKSHVGNPEWRGRLSRKKIKR